MNNAAIHAALDAVSDSLIGMATPFGDLLVYPENTNENPLDASRAYVQLYFMPAPTQYVGLQGGKGQIFTGVYQITLITPPGMGSHAADVVADAICDVFNDPALRVQAGTAAVTFPAPAYRTAGMHDEARSQTPITVMYTCCAG